MYGELVANGRKNRQKMYGKLVANGRKKELCVNPNSGAQRLGLCDVGEFEKRPPGTEAQLKN